MMRFGLAGKTLFFLSLLGLFAFSSGCRSIEEKKSEETPVTPVPVTPEKVARENVEFQAIDRGAADPENDKTIYYKIFLNKELALKTGSGLFFQKKTAATILEPGRYHFFAERWYLEEDPETEQPEYRRANNVWQMKPVYLDVPNPPDTVKVVFGIDHDKSEFYLEISTESPAE